MERSNNDLVARADVALFWGMAIGVLLMLQPVWSDGLKVGFFVTLVSTVLLAGVAFSLASMVTALWQLYLLVGVLGGVGAAGGGVMPGAVAALLFMATPAA